MLKTGIVMEIKNKNIYVLSPEGEILNLKAIGKVSPKIGTIYTGETTIKEAHKYKLVFITLIVVIILALSYLIFNKFFYTYSAVLDVNSTVELKLDNNNKVVYVKPLSSKSLKVTENLKFKHKNLNESTYIIVKQAMNLNYIDTEINIHISSHENTIDFNSFQKISDEFNIKISINDNGTLYIITPKK